MVHAWLVCMIWHMAPRRARMLPNYRLNGGTLLGSGCSGCLLMRCLTSPELYWRARDVLASVLRENRRPQDKGCDAHAGRVACRWRAK